MLNRRKVGTLAVLREAEEACVARYQAVLDNADVDEVVDQYLEAKSALIARMKK